MADEQGVDLGDVVDASFDVAVLWSWRREGLGRYVFFSEYGHELRLEGAVEYIRARALLGQVQHAQDKGMLEDLFPRGAPPVIVSLDPDKLPSFLGYAPVSQGHYLELIPIALVGGDSGRRRYQVVCRTCEEVIHEATTGPASRARSHLDDHERMGVVVGVLEGKDHQAEDAP